jgi:hypothetical protein
MFSGGRPHGKEHIWSDWLKKYVRQLPGHYAAYGLFFTADTWCKVHRSLRGKTPAMATGLTNHG